MKLSADLVAFQTHIGHRFHNRELLLRAVTHASISSATRPDNQRLEFLGDRVLGLVMAEALLAADAKAAEGLIAPRFNALVRKETCADIAREICLGEVLKLGRSEMMSGGRRKDAVLGDALEALIAAVYLDGGFEPAKALVMRLRASRITSVDDIARDAKSTLQEWAHARGMAPPIYTETGRDGPDHQPMFTVEVKLENGAGESARAGSKRVAEQVAARALLARLEQMND